jgi:Predicted glycosyltransferases
MNKKVSIILLNYNGAEDTLECVKSLEKINFENYSIIIVDNQSTDNSYNIIKENLGHKHVILSSGKNGGFAYGNNIGIRYALEQGADYVLLLNNDTLVEPDFLQELVKAAEEDDKVGLVTGKILYESKRNLIWYGGGRINWERFYGEHFQGVDDKTEVSRNVTFATGCLMLVKREVFNAVGLLPEEYFMYYEDVDFCAGLQEKGYLIRYVPTSVIYHKVSASTGEEESAFAVEWNTRNRLKFIRKYKKKIGSLSYIKLMLFFYTTRVITIVKYLLKAREDKVKALMKGLHR